MDRPKITGDTVEEYQRLANGKRALVFAVSVRHSENVATRYNEAGFRFAHMDGETPREIRAARVRAFAAGQLDGMTNCGLYSEGLDSPGVAVTVLLRPTQSLAMYLQMCGRALRPVYADGFDLSTAEAAAPQ